MKTLDDVLGYPLKIYQDRDWFCFSLDSVLLSNFSTVKMSTKKILDLGTGNGIIPIILSQRTKAKICGVEIQKDLADLAIESVKYNNLENQIFVQNIDMNELLEKKDIYNTFDLVLSNPPYFFDYDKSKKNEDIHKTIARHEVKIKLADIIKIASFLLKEGGNFCMINRTERFIEIIEKFKKYNIEPKKIRFIYKDKNSSSNMFFIEGLKNGNSGLEFLSPFYIYNLDKTYSSEYKNLCEKVRP